MDQRNPRRGGYQRRDPQNIDVNINLNQPRGRQLQDEMARSVRRIAEYNQDTQRFTRQIQEEEAKLEDLRARAGAYLAGESEEEEEPRPRRIRRVRREEEEVEEEKVEIEDETQLIRGIDEEEEEEQTQTTIRQVQTQILKDDLIEDISNLEFTEVDLAMSNFLSRLRLFLRTSRITQSNDELNSIIQFITRGDEYAILKFFAVAYRGVNLDQGDVRLGGRGRTTFDAWKQNFMRNLRAYNPNTARDFESSNILTDAARLERFARGTDRLLYRLQAPQVEYAFDRAAELMWRLRRDSNPAAADEAEYKATIVSILSTVHMGMAFANNTFQFSQDQVELVWLTFINVLRLMRAVFANGLTLPDVILAGSHYRREVIDGTEVRLLQAYPFLMTRQVGYSHLNAGRELMVSDTQEKIRWLIDTARVKDLRMNVRVKMLKTRGRDEGVALIDRPLTEEIYVSIPMDPLRIVWNPQQVEEFRSVLNRSHDEFRGILQTLYDADKPTIERWFLDSLQDFLNALSAKYQDLETTDGLNNVDLESIFIDFINIVGIEPEHRTLPPQRTALSTAFCKTASQGIVRKMAMFSECSSLGICIFEALWTYHHILDIRGKNHKEGLSYWKRSDREKLMLQDFERAPDQVKLMALHGNIPLLRITFGDQIPIVIWEEENATDMIEVLEGKDACLVIFDSHIFCATASKVRDQLRKRLAKQSSDEDEEEKKNEDPNKGKFVVRPKYTTDEYNRINHLEWLEKRRKNPEKRIPEPIEREEEEPTNYYLDIETSINKQTGKFTPYLICIVGERGEKWSWWGDDCVSEFLEWLTELVDEREGVEVSHNHKSKKIVIWTFNGMKFDLVFLVRNFVNYPSFELQGTWNDIKGIKINNVTFLDILKTSTFGPLKAQAEHYNTTRKKTEVNHEEITDEFIQMINEEEDNNLDLKLKKLEIIEYCENDCFVLMEICQAFRKWVVENLDINPYVSSAAGLAFRYWATHHNPAKIKDSKKIKWDKIVRGIPKWLYPILKLSYKGGIVAVLKKIKEDLDELVQYDINSSYPATMEQELIPREFKAHVKYSSKRSLVQMRASSLTDYFLYQVIDLKWKKNMRFPTIPKRTDSGLNHTTIHSPVDYIWGKELKFAMNTGMIEEGYITSEFQFDAIPMFASYVKELYHNRRKKCKENGDKASDKFYKLLLNSLYGKFGQKLYPKKVICNHRKLLYYAELIKGVPEEVCEGIWLVELDDDDYDNQIGTCIHVASYITACSRVRVLEPAAIISKNFTEDELYYFDTDSMILRKRAKMPAHLVSDSILGKWKLEKDNIVEYYAPAKKMYYLRYGEGGKETMKSKGITPRHMKREDYIELVETGVLKGKHGGDKWVRHRQGYVTKSLNVKDITCRDSRFYYNNGLSSMPKFE